jgi:hypothetical protein
MNEACLQKYYGLLKFIFNCLYAAGVTAASFAFFFKIVFDPIPEDNQQYANLILGFLMGTAVTSFVNYYFGSSQSQNAQTARDKDKPDPPAGTVTHAETQTTTKVESKTDPPKE